MRYLELPPHPGLASHVRCYWFLQGRAGVSAMGAPADPVLPDGRPELVFNLGDPASHRPADGSPRAQPLNMLVGQITRPFVFEPVGCVHFVGTRFTAAGAFAVFGLPMDEITNGWIDAEDLWPGTAELASRLSEANTPRRQAACLDAALRKRLARRGAMGAVSAVTAAAGLIEKSGGRLAVDGMASAVGLSGRQLARRFRAEVGIGPKRLSRITRFQAALRCVTGVDGISLAEVALRCGYYDQAHLVRDFGELAGASPGAFLAERHPLADHFTEASLRRDA